MKMSFQHLRLRGWEVCDLYVAPLASLSDLLNNQPRRACVYPFAVCFTLHILLTLRIRCGIGKKPRLFPRGVFDKIKGGPFGLSAVKTAIRQSGEKGRVARATSEGARKEGGEEEAGRPTGGGDGEVGRWQSAWEETES